MRNCSDLKKILVFLAVSDHNDVPRKNSHSGRKAVITILALGLAIAWLGRKSFQPPNENDISRPTLGSGQTGSEGPTATPLPPHFPAEATDTAPVPPTEATDQSLLSAIEKCWSDRQLSDLSSFDQFTVLDLEKVFGRVKKQELLQQKEELELKTGSRRTIELLPADASSEGLKAQISDLDAEGVPSVIASLAAAKTQGSDFKKWRLDSKTLRLEKKLGLLFDESLFKGGAAGTATEVDGRIQEFQVRADGKILKCSLLNNAVAASDQNAGASPSACECH
ncbi:MAG: hypothetical protein U1E10_04075 [Bdellovibrionales bacterium]|nr:hypothetical protein [Bdellovibrionales bacterium]